MATTFNSINGFSFGELGNTVIDSNGNVIANALSASGNATFTSAATSTSTTTGAVKVTGGVGITGNIYVGGNLNVAAKSNLGAVGNVVITGGTSAYVLSTDGLGNLSWVAQTGGGGASISNGTSNVNIASANGNVTVGVSGNANIVQFTGTGVNVAGTLQVTGVSNLGPVGNVVITGGSNGQMLTTDGSGNLTWTSSSGNITIDTFTGNGVQTIFTLSTTPTSNNFIQVNIDGVTQLHNAFTVASANVTMSAAPSSGAQIEVTTFALGGGAGGGGSGTFITRTYTGNGVQTTFTVTSGVTVDSVLVMENGVVQVPTTDYTVSGAVLTFTTAPAVAMGIQIRELASGGGGTPGGSNTYIQFNEAGSFGGTANLTWDGANFRVNTTTIQLGANAGLTSQGANSIAIGANAGVTSQATNSIIINATGATLNQTTANTFTVAPIRNDTSNVANVLYYNTSTKEISYAPQGGITAQDLLSPFLLMGA